MCYSTHLLNTFANKLQQAPQLWLLKMRVDTYRLDEYAQYVIYLIESIKCLIKVTKYHTW